jgi:hypothetical protein
MATTTAAFVKDLNSDGKDEIAVRSWDAQGDSVKIYGGF